VNIWLPLSYPFKQSRELDTGWKEQMEQPAAQFRAKGLAVAPSDAPPGDARLIRPEKEFPAIDSSTPLNDRFEAAPATTARWR